MGGIKVRTWWIPHPGKVDFRRTHVRGRKPTTHISIGGWMVQLGRNPPLKVIVYKQPSSRLVVSCSTNRESVYACGLYGPPWIHEGILFTMWRTRCTMSNNDSRDRQFQIIVLSEAHQQSVIVEVYWFTTTWVFLRNK